MGKNKLSITNKAVLAMGAIGSATLVYIAAKSFATAPPTRQGVWAVAIGTASFIAGAVWIVIWVSVQDSQRRSNLALWAGLLSPLGGVVMVSGVALLLWAAGFTHLSNYVAMLALCTGVVGLVLRGLGAKRQRYIPDSSPSSAKEGRSGAKNVHDEHGSE
ncbi:hypothetical protein BH18ACI5_BH18ACI5_10660 [soil metagenome]